MNNTITIELCAEDRARLDRLAEALERKACDKCVTSAIQLLKAEMVPSEPTKQVSDKPTEVISPVEEAIPMEEEPKTPAPVRTVDRAELRAKVIELSAKGLKDKVRDIVTAYAPTVKDVPDDKLVECYDSLVGLEG